MNENRRTPQKKRKMPLKQRVARMIVLTVQENEKKKRQAAQKKRAPQRKSQSRTTQSRAPQGRPTQQRRPTAQRPTNARPMTAEQKRKRAAELRRMRRRLRNIRIVAAVLLVLIIFLILSRTVLFKIELLDVTNPEEINYTVDQVVAQSGVTYGTVNLFACNLEKVEKNIEQRLPYIGDAVVERDFPSTLHVTLTPTVATAAIAYGNSYLLIDENGKMLEDAATAPDGIPVLRCNTEFAEDLGQYIGVAKNTKDDKEKEKVEAAAAMIELYKKVMDAAKQAGIDDLTLIDIRDDHAITLMYQNRITLHLGTEDLLETKLKTAAKTISTETDASKARTGAMDLTSVPYAYVRDTFETTDPVQAEITTEVAENAAE